MIKKKKKIIISTPPSFKTISHQLNSGFPSPYSFKFFFPPIGHCQVSNVMRKATRNARDGSATHVLLGVLEKRKTITAQ